MGYVTVPAAPRTEEFAQAQKDLLEAGRKIAGEAAAAPGVRGTCWKTTRLHNMTGGISQLFIYIYIYVICMIYSIKI